MTAPLLTTGALSPSYDLFFALLIGIGFGFFLERAGFGSARKLVAQFYLTDLSVFKLMFTAIVTAMVGVIVLSRAGFLDIAEIRVYDGAAALKASTLTNGDGKAYFWYLPPGPYTVCETQRPGWTNTQPGTTNANFGGNPCYSFALQPGDLANQDFGNIDGPASVRGAAAAEGLRITAGYFVDNQD